MMNIFQMLGSIKDPNKFVDQVMNNGSMNNNPIAKNAFEMYQKGDAQGINELAKNLCETKGIKLEDAIRDIKSQFGM